MKFFSPELYRRFNSSDDDEADRADEEWEVATRGYRAHLHRLDRQFSRQAKALGELCLHDAEVVATDQIADFVPVSIAATGSVSTGAWIVSVAHGREIVTLFYSLWDPLREQAPGKGWPFSKRRPQWLYDEIDVGPAAGTFLHRILLSDGRTLEVPFVSAIVHRLPTPESSFRTEPRQIA